MVTFSRLIFCSVDNSKQITAHKRKELEVLHSDITILYEAQDMLEYKQRTFYSK
jgi:hypothetical protein